MSSPLVPARTSKAVSTPWAMSGDWAPMLTVTPQVRPSKPMAELLYPIERITSRTRLGIST